MIDRNARDGDAALDQWFTPFWAAEDLTADALRGMGAVSICEPSCGTGAFLAAAPASCPAFGIDIDPRVVEAARVNSGREVLVGDYRTLDLGGREVQLVIGNPPFPLHLVDAFVARSYGLLPEGGRVAFVLPAFAFQTPSRVTRWQEEWSIDVAMIPRTLFGKISQALVWAKFTKTGDRRFHGLLLFREQRDVELMREHIRDALVRPGTWRAAVQAALESIGGAGSLQAIYDAITPERHAGRAHWREKVRQILQLHHTPVERGRWAL